MEMVATTTAWGCADPLDVVLDRIARNTDVHRVELSIGARPVGDPWTVLDRWRHRFAFQAHHTAPIGAGCHVRPDVTADPVRAVAAVVAAGCDRYSGHPPNRNTVTWDGFLRWALTWWETCAAEGVNWSVETMYVPRLRDEQERSGGYWLATPFEVWEFCRHATAAGWDRPLLVDASHMRIGVAGGGWTAHDVAEVFACAPVQAVHVSTNDGRRDEHLPAPPDSEVWRWVLPHADRYGWCVDEGKRTRTEPPAGW